MKQQLIITLTPHSRLGYLMLPVMADYDPLPESYSITEAVTPASSCFSSLQPVEQEVVKLAARYSVKNLMKSYSKEKREADFLERVTDREITQYIRPFIEKRHLELIRLIKGSLIPLFVRDELKERHFRREKAVVLLEEPSRMHFHFSRKEIFTYRARVFNNEREVGLLDRQYIPLVSKPAVCVIGQELHHFVDVDEQKLKPFLQQQQIVVPERNVEAYIRGFVLKCVKRYDTTGEGLSIVELHHQPVAELTLETDFQLQPVLTLRFRYGSRYFAVNEPRQKEVELIQVAGENAVGWYYRDAAWEQEQIKKLSDSGLLLTPTGQFVVEDSGKEPAGDDLLEWINNHGAILNTFRFLQSESCSHFYTGPIALQMNICDHIDWFDIESIVSFGEIEIPFICFKDHILNHERRYQLPDGRVAILPKAWFTRYEELFRYGKTEKQRIRLQRFHYPVKELAEKGFIPVEELDAGAVSAMPPPGLSSVLRPYQLNGFRWLVHLRRNGFGGCLADDMGLGKTLQAIALLQWIYVAPDGIAAVMPQRPRQLSLFDDDDVADSPSPHNDIRGDLPPSLIVMPTSLIHNWKNEFNKFAPALEVYPHTGPSRLKGEAFLRMMGRANIVLTSYGLLRQDIGLLSKCRFHYLVLDESQHIKNPASQNFGAVKQISARYRLALTGTPIENSLTDLWAQMDFLNEGILEPLSAFRSRFRESDVINDEEERQKLKQIIQPFILRRTKEEVAPELPSLTSEIIWCEMGEMQADIYEQERSRIRNTLLDADQRERRSLSATVLAGLTRLRLLANHPAMLQHDYSGDAAKFEQIVEQAEVLFAEGHKVLIFSSFVKQLKLISRYFDERGWSYAWLSGSTTNREAVIREFETDERKQAFLISLQAGGTGLNLTTADYVFLVDPWWNPSAELQAVSRAHRIGQHKPVTFYRFITRDTIEEKIRHLQEKKQALADGLMGSQLTVEELEALLA